MTEPDRSGERLQKILARAGLGSRRLMEAWIEEGKVTVNGRVARLGDRADLERDAVKVDGRRVAAPSPQHKYVLLNKPTYHVCTLSDPEGRPTIMDLIPDRLHSGLVPVGRLDYDSEGLILLTDDGELAHRIAHPRYGCHKAYEVKVKGRPNREALAKLEEGMLLYGKPTAPVIVTPHRLNKPSRESQSNSWWKVMLTEGRTRQIREMFFRLGHPVTRLRRVGIGQLRDPHLAVGSWRMLTEQEVEDLRQRTAKVVAPKKVVKKSRRSYGSAGPQRRRSGAVPSAKGRRRPQGGGAQGVDLKPFGDRPDGDRPRSDRPTGDRPRSDRPRSDRPTGDRPARRGGDSGGAAGPRRSGPGRPSGKGPGRPTGGRSTGSRPTGGRDSGGRGPGGRGAGGRSSGSSSGSRNTGGRGPGRGPAKSGSGPRGTGKRGPGNRGPGKRGPGNRGPGGRGGGKR